jgi:hypothetical protein
MLATVVATTTPYVAVVDDTRAFRFPDLAAGQYTLRWNVSGRAGEKTVTVGTTAVDTTIP